MTKYREGSLLEGGVILRNYLKTLHRISIKNLINDISLELGKSPEWLHNGTVRFVTSETATLFMDPMMAAEICLDAKADHLDGRCRSSEEMDELVSGISTGVLEDTKLTKPLSVRWQKRKSTARAD